MPPKKRSRDLDIADDYVSDDGFVASDDDAPRSKKTKATTTKSAAAKATPSKGTSGNEPIWELSSGKNSRRVGISEFKGTRLVNIREYYQNAGGEFLPGKKGISLSIEQYRALLAAIPKINTALVEMGEDVVITGDPGAEDTKGGGKAKGEARSKAKERKANIDATSDEEEEEEEEEE